MNSKLLPHIRTFISHARGSVHAQRVPDKSKKSGWGYNTIPAPIDDEMLRKHLNGGPHLGSYLMEPESDTTRVAVLDFDDHDGSIQWSEFSAVAKAVCEAAERVGLSPWSVRSGGGRGIHVCFRWDKQQPAKAVRECLSSLLEVQGLRVGTRGVANKEVEIFPKQDAVGQEGYGSLVALPFGRKSVPLDTDLQPVTTPLMWRSSSPPKAPGKTRRAPPSKRKGHDTDITALRGALSRLGADNYDNWTKVGLGLKSSLGDDGFELWDEWSKTSDEYPGETEARKKWDGFKPRGDITIGSVFHWAKAAGWEPLEGEADDAVTAVVAKFNERYMVVNEGGKALVYERKLDPALKRWRHEASTFDDLRKLYQNDRVRAGVRMRSAAEIWLSHPDRRQYLGGLAFDPSGEHLTSDMLNLWQGFACKPARGDWSLLQRHMLEIVCGGNKEHLDYLMGWMARCVQKPAQRGETAVVMKGNEGCGKGILANALRQVFGPHGLLINNSRHLIGNFNAHLQDTVFLFADEAFFAGDKSHVGIIKSLITEEVITIEAKYRNAVQRPNHIHLMMASNEKWVVPAALDSRRFFVLNVLSDRIGDYPYFEGIAAQLENGGHGAMLHDLMTYDISTFNVRRIPMTSGLNEQRLTSLKTEESWWLDVLMRGYVYCSRLGLESYFSEWHEATTTELLFKSYSDFASQKRERRPLNREDFGRFMITMGGSSKHWRNAVTGEHLTDDADGKRTATPVSQDRARGYVFGSLANARELYIKATKLSVEWPEQGQDGETDEYEVPDSRPSQLGQDDLWKEVPM